MTIGFQCVQDNTMPKLGWLAFVDHHTDNTLNVLHGEYVENGGDWLVEGVWDGRFVDGTFHCSECFFGSGIKIENDKIIFVPSIAKMDRIFFCRDKDRLLFSNSLLLMLAGTGASLDDEHDYRDESTSIVLHGLTNYKKAFKVIHPRIHNFFQVFHENIVVEKGVIAFEPKPCGNLSFDDYEDYHRALVEKLEKLKQNYNSSSRKWPLKSFTTLSTGYDSTAVSCLASKIGVKECFVGRPLDGLIFKQPAEPSGKIGKRLGMNVHRLDSRRKHISRDERFFLAGNYPKHSKSVWSEISLHSMVKAIQKHQSPAVVFMGYHGDDVWGDKGDLDPETGDLLCTPPISGSNLAEIRLSTGFFTISPAYIFLRNIDQIKKITDSREMDPWRLGNNYDRPIPRRIAEEVGIPREWFGMKKHHITTTYFWPINKDNRQAYYRYLKNHLNISNWYVTAYGLQRRIVISFFNKNLFFGKHFDFYDLMRKWATNVLKKEYATIISKHRFLDS